MARPRSRWARCHLICLPYVDAHAAVLAGYMNLQNPSQYFVKAIPLDDHQQESVEKFDAKEGECSGVVLALCRLVWGNQETIWTLSGGAMTARPSARILYLSKPKKDFTKCQRRPLIGGRILLTKFGYPSERLLRLAEPKKYLPAFLEKRARESPEWPVSLAAQNYKPSKRILELARPKGLHPDFMPPREVPTQVSSLATSAKASARVQKLAEPLIKELTCCSRHNQPGFVISMVSSPSQKAVASPRTIELARPKELHSNFKPPRDPEWPVTKAAKRAVATPRILELAQPTSRPRLGLTVKPDAFKVKQSALKAVCSERLNKLAQPVRR